MLTYLKERQPRGFIVEEVLGFADRDSQTNKPYIVMFQEAAAELGFATRSFVLKGGLWGEVQRDRYYIFGVSKDLGHAKAVDWMCEKVEEVNEYRAMFKPAPIFSMESSKGVLSFDKQAKQMRSQSRACICRTLPEANGV
jgi:hypothetical protein